MLCWLAKKMDVKLLTQLISIKLTLYLTTFCLPTAAFAEATECMLIWLDTVNIYGVPAVQLASLILQNPAIIICILLIIMAVPVQTH